MVSMKDIAAACNVSVATVSKALNNHSDIGEETRQLVKQKAKEMGYHPNFSARALKTNRSYNLGVLFVDEARSGLTHDYFSHVLESFKVTAENSGYDITFLNNSKLRKDKMSYLEHSLYRSMDGVVIACVDFNDAEVVELLQSQLPVVTIDYLFNGRISVISDNVRGMRDLMNYIFSMGHKRIAYIHGADSAVTGSRVASFYKCMEDEGIEVRDEYIREAQYRDSLMAGEVTNELLDLKEPPTCIMYPDDYSAIGGMNAIKNRGLRIPEDISIAGYDGIPIATQLNPPLTTLHQDTEKIGRLAAEKLVALIEKPKSTIIGQEIVRGELLTGATVKKI